MSLSAVSFQADPVPGKVRAMRVIASSVLGSCELSMTSSLIAASTTGYAYASDREVSRVLLPAPINGPAAASRTRPAGESRR